MSFFVKVNSTVNVSSKLSLFYACAHTKLAISNHDSLYAPYIFD